MADRQWFALQVRYRQEFRVADQLKERGIEEYTPFLFRQRNWSDRTKNIRVPLFPGYTFCKIDPEARLLPILTMPGAIHFVGGSVPTSVPEEEIEWIRKAIAGGGMLWVYPGLATGEMVEVHCGPLAGCCGRIEKVDDAAWALVISITLLQRSLAVAVDPAWVEVIPRNKKVQQLAHQKTSGKDWTGSLAARASHAG
jgi:transcription antitermination factor NusG